VGTMKAWLRRVLSDWLNPPHEHVWKAQNAQYFGRAKSFNFWGFDDGLVERLIYGQTVANFRCERCHDYKQSTYIGRVNIEGLESWKDAA